jgi:hypothetical protein
MKSPKMLKYMIIVTALVMPSIPTLLLAQQQPARHSNYKVVDLGTLGGPNSYVTFTVVGTADTRFADPFAPQCLLDCFLVHSFQWREGKLTDLKALADNASSNPNGINAKGVIAGISENGLTDSAFASAPEFDAVVWKDGQILDVGTFGGTFSYANAINNRNQVVGFALNGTRTEAISCRSSVRTCGRVSLTGAPNGEL